MTSKPFVPLSAKLVDEGEMIDELDKVLEETLHGVVKFRKEHGSRAHKAKAKVTLTVEVVCTDPETGAYQMNWGVNTTMPKRPVQSSFAIEGTGEDGSATLFVRGSGSDDGDPTQLKLATRDGRAIDPTSGVPMED